MVRFNTFIFIVLTFVSNTVYGELDDFKEPIFYGIRNAHQLKSFIHKYTKEANDIAPVRLDSVMAELGPLTGSEDSLANRTARLLLDDRLEDEPYRYEVGNTCLNHTKIFLDALLNGKSWGLQSKSLN